jgi:DNA-binding NarL/FixJ family response regulator
VNTLKVLLVDDHAILREGLKALIDSQADMRCVGEASDGRTGVAAAQNFSPDVVVMDVSMPNQNGFQATEEILRRWPTMKVVALSRHADDSYVQQLLKAGASGYVLKQSPSTSLLTAIRTVATGQSYLDPAITARVVGGYLGKRDKTKISRAEPSDRETEVLRLIAIGFSNKEIAAQLNLSVKTVEVHKANAMRKLNMRGRIDIVRFAVLQGWLNSE